MISNGIQELKENLLATKDEWTPLFASRKELDDWFDKQSEDLDDWICEEFKTAWKTNTGTIQYKENNENKYRTITMIALDITVGKNE